MQSSLIATALIAASLMALPEPSAAQSLRGSHASVSLVYRRAVRGDLVFEEVAAMTAGVRRKTGRGAW